MFIKKCDRVHCCINVYILNVFFKEKHCATNHQVCLLSVTYDGGGLLSFSSLIPYKEQHWIKGTFYANAKQSEPTSNEGCHFSTR